MKSYIIKSLQGNQIWVLAKNIGHWVNPLWGLTNGWTTWNICQQTSTSQTSTHAAFLPQEKHTEKLSTKTHLLFFLLLKCHVHISLQTRRCISSHECGSQWIHLSHLYCIIICNVTQAHCIKQLLLMTHLGSVWVFLDSVCPRGLLGKGHKGVRVFFLSGL